MTDAPALQPEGFVVVVSTGHRLISSFGFVRGTLDRSDSARASLVASLRDRLGVAASAVPALDPPLPGVAPEEQGLATAVMIEMIKAAISGDEDAAAALVLGVTLLFEDPNICITLEATPDGGAMLGLQTLEGRTFAEVDEEVKGLLANLKSMPAQFSFAGSNLTVH